MSFPVGIEVIRLFPILIVKDENIVTKNYSVL